jgi:hypothetical protein
MKQVKRAGQNIIKVKKGGRDKTSRMTAERNCDRSGIRNK